MKTSRTLSLGFVLLIGFAGAAIAARPPVKAATAEPPTYYDDAGLMMGPALVVEGLDNVLLRIEGRAFAFELAKDDSSGYGATWGRNKPVYFANSNCTGTAYLQNYIMTGMSTATAVQYDVTNQAVAFYVSVATAPESVLVGSVAYYDFEQQAHRCDPLVTPVQADVLPVFQKYSFIYTPPFVIR